jgi:hypothetical protein
MKSAAHSRNIQGDRGIQNQRSGRIPSRKTNDLHPEVSYGDTIYTKDNQHLRIFFQNVKGLTYTNTSDDYRYYSNAIRDLQLDIVCLAETNKPWQLLHHRQEFYAAMTRNMRTVKVDFASPSLQVDPISDMDNFQSGGCLTMVCRNWVSCVYGPPLIDKQGLGRWTGVTIRGKNNNFLTIVTAYRTCNGNISTAPLGSTYAREYEYYKDKGFKSPNPRNIFVDELKCEIKQLLDKGHQIILSLDANTIAKEDKHFQNMLETCDLYDLHGHDPAPSTFIGSSNRRIDYIYGSPTVIEGLSRSGTLSYLEGPQADHRALFIDLDIRHVINYNPIDHSIPSARTRDLKTGNPELVERYSYRVNEEILSGSQHGSKAPPVKL